MSHARIITIVSVSLIVSAIGVFHRARENPDVHAAPDHFSTVPEAEITDQAPPSPAHARLGNDLKKALSGSAKALHAGDQHAVRRSMRAIPLVRIDKERLSIKARAVPLRRLLADIVERSGIAVYSEMAAEESVSIAFENLPLDEGLRRILKHHDTFFLYGGGGASHTPTALWIYPRGRGREMAPVPPERWASTAELEQESVNNPNTGARMRAVEAVIERKGDQSLETVVYALSDANEQVRYSALSGALSVGLKLPAGTLTNLMLYDPSPFVRSLALQFVSERAGADKLHVRSMAHAALTDAHRDVRAQARDVLVTLEQPDRSQTLTRTVSDLREMLQKQSSEIDAP